MNDSTAGTMSNANDAANALNSVTPVTVQPSDLYAGGSGDQQLMKALINAGSNVQTVDENGNPITSGPQSLQTGGGLPANIVGSIAGGQFTPNANNPLQKQQIGGGAGSVGTSFSDWLNAHAGNWGLVVLGVLLAIGALLISQRQTIVQVGRTVAETMA